MSLFKSKAQETPITDIPKRAFPATKKRKFDAAKYQPTLGFLQNMFTDFNDEIKNDIKSLRARSRDASINDAFARRYLKSLIQNVIGPNGVQLKMGIKTPNGKPDDMANYMLEQRWLQFVKSVTPDGKNLREALKIALETTARDGEIFCVIRKGTNFGKYLLNVQFYDSEYVDIDFNEVGSNGFEIRQGIEYDFYGRPVAYHMWKYHPESITIKQTGYNERIRIPAEEVIHLYNRERCSQGRGFPWMSASLLSLAHVKEYTKSELIASRVASAKMGFFTKPLGAEDDPGDYQENGDFIQEAQPGMFDVLPEGWTLSTFDPQNPNSNYSSFIKTILEGIAASLGIAYHTLSGDLSSANYSSLRAGMLQENETFRECQMWLIESFLNRLFEQWLGNVIAFQLEGIRLPMSKFDQFNSPIWRPRTWNAVDPQKEQSAIQIQLQQNIRSRTDVCRANGMDYVDVLNEIAAEQELARSLGVVIEPTQESSLNAAVANAVANVMNTDDAPNPPQV